MRRVLAGMMGMALCSAPGVAASDDDDERFTEKQPPPIEGLEDEAEEEQRRSPVMAYDNPDDLTFKEYGERPYNPSAYQGAEALQLDPQFVHMVQEGLTLMYLRDYPGAREHFAEIEQTFPHTGVAAVADTLVWQALMLENFDFKYDKQYRVSTRQARADLEKALSIPGNDGWEHFLMGGVLGIESIHTMRQGSFLPALQLAFSAMDHVQKAREGLPGFIDLKLADGMYNYWRSVVTLNSKILPDFGDHRKQGIEEMKEVEKQGFFLQPAATLSLAFSWLEEADYRRALISCTRNRRAYPDNIINNMVTGSTLVYMRKYPEALDVYDAILQADPNNRRVHYWRGLALLRSGKLKLAEEEFKTYLASEHLEDYQRAYTHYRLGQVYHRRKEHAEAYESFKTAVKIDGHKGAKKAMDRMKDAKKNGKIDF